MMTFKVTVKQRTFAANSERQGVFELVHGAYQQHRGTMQTPTFRDEQHLRRYVQRMLRGEV